jgi:hypothetical protein
LPEQGRLALAITAWLASGITNFARWLLHVGQCTKNGLFAALLARDDHANPGVFEHAGF